MTVEEDTGDVWVLDSHYQNLAVTGSATPGLAEENPPRMLGLHFNDADKTVAEVGEWAVTPPGTSATNQARIYGVDITSDDVFYFSDAWNRRAYRYAKDGTYLSTFGQTQTGGDNRGVTVDEEPNRVYVVDAEHSDVDVFTMAGTYLEPSAARAAGPGSSPAAAARSPSTTSTTSGSVTSAASKSTSSPPQVSLSSGHPTPRRRHRRGSSPSRATPRSTTATVTSGWRTPGASGSRGSAPPALISVPGASAVPAAPST